MKYIILFSVVFFSSLLFISCSDLKNDISPAPEINIHGSDVFNPASPNYHGKRVLESTNKLADCQQCHASDFSGGTAQIGCTSSNCHPTISVHKEGIVEPASNNFHPKYLKNNNKSMVECAQCHGENYSGGLISPTCVNCHGGIGVHKEGIVDPVSINFHAQYLKSNNKLMTECSQCHGENYSGGLIAPTCANCHSAIGVHKEGIVDPVSINFHSKYLKNNSKSMTECSQCHGGNYSGGLISPTCVNCHSGIGVHKDGMLDPNSVNFHGKFIASKNWDLAECSQCHSANYSGGLVSASCLTCHTQTNGPEACNTCHGVFDDPSKIAPNVGAHYAHLYENELGKQVDCNQCHTVPNSFAAAGHIDSQNGAEIVFGSLAKLKTNSPGAYSQTPTLPEFVPNPSYNSSTGTCSNVYCHGYFKNGNTTNAVSFGGGSSVVNCGSCHGNPTTGNPLPGGSHPAVQNCSFCHGDVVSVSGSTYTIIDMSKHINGKLNFVNGVEQTY